MFAPKSVRHRSFCWRRGAMYKDEIIADVWKNREAYAVRHHHSLSEIVSDLQKRQKTPFSRLVDRREKA